MAVSIGRTETMIRSEYIPGLLGQMSPLQASRLIVDKYSSRILSVAFRLSKTPQEISEECDIPIAVCYRRIKQLEKMGLIECVERHLTREGKRVKKYKSMVHYARIFLENGKWMVEFRLSTGATYTFNR